MTNRYEDDPRGYPLNTITIEEYYRRGGQAARPCPVQHRRETPRKIDAVSPVSETERRRRYPRRGKR